MNKYKYEISVALIGGIVSIIELFLDVKLGFFIISITILLDLSVLGIRTYIKECLREYSEIHNLVHSVNNKYWRALAEKELLRTKEILNQMEQGKREIRSDEITFEELRLIKQAKKYIYCTYYADSLAKLKIRLNSQSKYNPMLAINVAYKNTTEKNICKKRIFILDKLDINAPEIKTILEEIDEYYSSASIGFIVKYIFYSKLREMSIAYMGNMVLVDDIESTLCIDNTQYPKDYFDKDQNIARDIKASNVINNKLLEDYKYNFEKIWNISLSLSELFS